MNKKHFKIPIFPIIIILTIFLLFFCGSFASAATYTVTNALDTSDPGTLRTAINSANADPGSTINFDNNYNIVLSSNLPEITAAATTIDGTGHTIIVNRNSSSGSNYVFKINNVGSCVIKAIDIRSGYYGIWITGASATSNIVKGCTIATTSFCNIYISSAAASNTIGGTTSAERNIISGGASAGYGVYITGAGTNNNVVSGNYIGINAAGTASSYAYYGVVIFGGAQSNTIGGTTDGERNVIVGYINGILISDASTSYNVVKGNYIGLNAAGTAALSTRYGVQIKSSASNNTIGGTTGGDRNIICGTTYAGIQLESNSNVVYGNYVGTNPAGTSAIANKVGIYISGQSNTIGGSGAGEKNIISGNSNYGIQITNNSNIVKGNYIGVGSDGASSIPNTYYGVYLSAGTSNVIGGTGVGEGNVIANNGNSLCPDNVRVDGVNTKYNKVLSNSIYNSYSTGKGIALVNSANESISPPTISTANTTTVTGTGGTNGGRVEVFKVDSRLSNEGKTFVGSCTAAIDGTWSCSVSGLVIGDYITATTTNTNNSTSEFCSNKEIPDSYQIVFITSAQPLSTNALSSIMTIQIQDAGGTPYNVPSDTTIDLSSSSLGGNFYSDSGGTTPITSVTITNGTSSANFYYKDLYPGTATITCAENPAQGWTDATQNETVTGNFYVVNNGASGWGSLANAITGANSHAGADTILFNNSYTITLTGDTTEITEQLTIDGESNTIVINRNSTAGDAYIFKITCANCIINNLVLQKASKAIWIYGASATGNTVKGCKIGTNAAGDSSTGVANADGVYIDYANSNTVGGTTEAERNIISGCSSTAGVVLNSANTNVVKGNYIGLNAAGTSALANRTGVYISSGISNVIGGSTEGERNIISGSTYYGIDILAAGTGNIIKGNYIGLNAAGTSAVPNSWYGIQVNMTETIIGGSNAGEGNVISGNSKQGIYLGSWTATVKGNYIGLNAAGTSAIPNNTGGISIIGSYNTIGGTSAGEGNVIANNGSASYPDNVRVDGVGAKYNKILGNSIYDSFSGGRGIELINGANENITAPAIVTATTTTVAGTGGTNGGRVEVFVVDSHAYTYPSGKTFVGSCTAVGDGSWSCSVSGANAGDYVVAAATNTNNDTSEFSTDMIVSAGPLDHFDLTIATPQANGAVFTGTCTITAKDAAGSTITTFDASTNNATLTFDPGSGTITGLGSGNNNVLNQADDFSSGVANLASKMIFTGDLGSHTFTATSADSKIGTSGSVIITGPLDHFDVAVNSPQTSGAVFAGACTVTAKDASDNTITTFDASTNNVTMASPEGGTITGLGTGNNNVLNKNTDFLSGVANLTTLGMIFTGTSGTHTFTADSGGKIGTSGNVTISAGLFDHFVFILATSQRNTVAFTGVNTLTACDLSNNVITNFDASADNVEITSAPADGVVSGLGSGGNNVLNQASDFVSGVANLTGAMKFTGNVGNHTFTATSATTKTGISGTVNMLANVPSKLVITTSTQTINTNTASAVITVEAQDSLGNPVTLEADQVVSLTTSSISGRFDTTAGGSFDGTVTSVTILNGASSANLYYKDSIGGTPTVTCAPSGQSWTSAAQVETINKPDNSGLVEGVIAKGSEKFARVKIEIYAEGQGSGVKALGTEEEPKTAPIATIYADVNGVFSTDLSSGSYVFKMTNITGYGTFQQSVDVTQGQTTDVTPRFIDPVGVIYDSSTKGVLQGATVTITETDTGVVGYTVVTGANGRYQWLAALARRYTITATPPNGYNFPSTIIPASTPPDPMPGPAQNNVNGLTTGIYYLNFRYTAASGDLINNDIPLDIANFQNLRISKTVNKRYATIGDVVAYTLTIENPNAFAVNNFTIEDTPAPQLKILTNTAVRDGSAVLTAANDFPFTLPNLNIAANGTTTIIYKAVIGSHVKINGTYTNSVMAKNVAGVPISALSKASVSIIADALFDEGTVIGVVFDDKNKNGVQDKDEPGIPNAYIYNEQGVCVITDEEGKYHFAGLKAGQISLFKVDIVGLPAGYEFITENPRWINVTRGSLYEINFGAAKK